MTATPRRHHGQSTQRDVAREAGVSIMTVSNVINGKHRMMTKETREAVEAAIARLNYRPDSVGRGLRLSRRFSLGLLVVDPSPTFIADYFTTQVVAGLSNSLSQKGYGILIQGASSERLVDIASLRAGGTDALCVMISGAPEERRMLRERLADLNHPFVVLQDQVPEAGIDAMAIRQDDEGGGFMLGAEVLRKGCRHLVYLCESHPWPALENRLKGIQRALSAVDQGASLNVVKAATAGLDDAQVALTGYVAQHGMPDAVLGGNDQMGIAALLWLQGKGLSIPEEIKVTGFNGFEFARFAVPKLTTVRSAAYAIGDLAATAVLERLQGGVFPGSEAVLPVTFEAGGST